VALHDLLGKPLKPHLSPNSDHPLRSSDRSVKAGDLHAAPGLLLRLPNSRLALSDSLGHEAVGQSECLGGGNPVG
jgi:hypothetical protein